MQSLTHHSLVELFLQICHGSATAARLGLQEQAVYLINCYSAVIVREFDYQIKYFVPHLLCY